MWQKWRTGKPGGGSGAPAIKFWEVLNTIATALQRAAHSETAVYEAFREQMTALKLQGSINWLDETYTTLTIASVVFPPRLMRVLHRFEKMAGQTAVGFQLPVTVLEEQRAVIEGDTAVFVPDNTPLLEALATQRVRPFLQQFLRAFGGMPGVLAPLYMDNRVRGLLYLADQSITADDCTAVTALANHLSVAIENARLFQQTRANEEKMRLLTENVPGIIYQCVNNYTFDMLYLNDAIEILTGYSKEQFLSGELSFRDLYHPDDTSLIQPEREEQAKDGMFHITYRLRHRNGGWRWVEEFGKGVFNEAGKLLFLEGSIIDITERKQAEAVQLALYRIATVANADLSLEQLYQAIHAILGNLMDVRNFFIALVMEPSGLLDLPYFVDEVDEYDGGLFDGRGGLSAYVIETEQPQLLTRPELNRLIEQKRLRLIGAMPEVWLGAPLQTQGRVFGAIAVQSYHDVRAYTDREKQLLFFVSGQVATAIDRKRSEDQLRAMAAEIAKQARIFEEVLSTTPDQFMVYGRDGRITFASPSLFQLLHLSPADVLGKTLAELSFLPPDIVAQIERDHAEVLRYGQPIQAEIQVTGEWGVRDVEYILSPITDEQEMVTAVVCAARDITQRNKTKAALHHAQKMESLAILAGGVAHDFNNLLVGMLSQTSLAIAKLPPDSPAVPHIQKAIQTAERAAALTKQMLAYSGHGQFTAVPINLNHLIQENLHLLQVTISSHLHTQLDLAPTLPLIEGDPGQIQQLLLNLGLNSSESIGSHDGVIRLATGVRPITAADEVYWQTTNIPLPPGDYVCLTVADNGEGMSEQTLARLFEPFFTTRFTGRGLGLAAVLGIVIGHQGGLRVVSAPGAGATFELVFPVSQVAMRTAVPPPPTSTYPGMVLVVDDEPAVCDTVVDILELEHIQTVTAVDGASGIAAYRHYQGQIGLVLLDLTLPDLRGEEVFNQLKAIDPHVQVILSSGYNEMEALRGFNGDLVAFLQKPYALEDLVKVVRQHLPTTPPDK